MTNGERFKTTDERRIAYNDYLVDCAKKHKAITDKFGWLDLEAKVELLSCPFCGGEATLQINEDKDFQWVECTKCHSMSFGKSNADESIAAWNRRAK